MTLAPETVLAVQPVSIVPEGDEFLVGDAARGEFVLLPAIGVDVLRLLQRGLSLGEVTTAIGSDVDVADFAQTLCELGFAAGDAAALPGVARTVGLPFGLRHVFGRVGWSVAIGCVALSGLLAARWPALIPTYHDIFFLPSPVLSIVCITLLTYALAAAHEACHWAAARAVGVDARITVNRRLYFLVLETDLSGLWSLPRHQRYGPLLAGMAFDASVLGIVSAVRAAGLLGVWLPAAGVDALLGGVAFVQVMAIVVQGYIFMRTDLYAVLVTATGCINLWRVNQLRLLRAIGRLTADQRDELASAHPRDLQVAGWYAPVSVLGVALALASFVGYFVPATILLVSWLAESILAARFASLDFWAAIGFAGVVLSPRVLTLGVLARDVSHRVRGRNQTKPRLC